MKLSAKERSRKGLSCCCSFCQQSDSSSRLGLHGFGNCCRVTVALPEDVGSSHLQSPPHLWPPHTWKQSAAAPHGVGSLHLLRRLQERLPRCQTQQSDFLPFPVGRKRTEAVLRCFTPPQGWMRGVSANGKTFVPKPAVRMKQSECKNRVHSFTAF